MPLTIYNARPSVDEIICEAGYRSKIIGENRLTAQLLDISVDYVRIIYKPGLIWPFVKTIGFLFLRAEGPENPKQFWVHKEKYFPEAKKLSRVISKKLQFGDIEVINRSIM